MDWLNTAFVKQFQVNDWTAKKNLENITHGQSLEIHNNTNPVNWVFGHVVLSRVDMIEIVKGDWQLPPAWDIYKRGSEFGITAEKGISLENLKTAWDESQEILLSGIGKLALSDWQEQLTERRNRLEQLWFYYFHEVYHLGQLGVLRKMLGNAGAIQ